MSINTIHNETPSNMLEEAVRQWMAAGCGTRTGDDLISTDSHIKCEMDGERMDGVLHASIEIDADGDACLMLFRDSTLAAHVAAMNGVRLPLAVTERGGRHEKNK